MIGRQTPDHLKARNLGEIVVEVWRSQMAPHADGFLPNPTHVADVSEVSEKQSKGRKHMVTLGTPRPIRIPSDTIYSVTMDRSPIAVFTFLYNTRDILRAQKHIPPPDRHSIRCPSSSGSRSVIGSKRKAFNEPVEAISVVKKEFIDIVSIEQQEEAVRRAEENLRQARAKLYNQRGRCTVKLEQVSTFLPGETIDLTSD
ncbi:hypothetical protein FB107DRAFT_224674 [Schizophyllum commune]